VLPSPPWTAGLLTASRLTSRRKTLPLPPFCTPLQQQHERGTEIPGVAGGRGAAAADDVVAAVAGGGGEGAVGGIPAEELLPSLSLSQINQFKLNS
jgi:hypothetical protein